MGKTFEHKGLIIPSVNDTVEVIFNDNGIESGTNPYVWYFGLEYAANAIVVQVSAISHIIEVNGETLKTPITIVANGSFTDSNSGFKRHKYRQVKIKITTANTNVEVTGKV